MIYPRDESIIQQNNYLQLYVCIANKGSFSYLQFVH